jgi:CrcB protein
MFVNVVGSLIVGIFASLIVSETKLIVSDTIKHLLIIGFCGGFTTFSSFSLQTYELLQGGEFLSATLNIILSFGLCLAAVYAGFFIAARFW